MRAHRQAEGPFDVAVDGTSQPGEHALMRDYETAGATWWFEGIFGRRASDEELFKRILAGP